MNFLVAAVLTVCLCDGASGVGQKGRPGEYASQSSGQFQESGTIEMKSPNLNDEEFHSSHMPDYLKCDSCRAISYQGYKANVQSGQGKPLIQLFASSKKRFNPIHGSQTRDILCAIYQPNMYSSETKMQEYLLKWESKNSAVKEGKTILNESDYTDALEKCCSQSWEKHGVIQLDGVKRLSGPGLETEDFTGVMMTSGPWPARLFKMCQAYLGEFTEEDIYNEYRNNPNYLEDFLCFDKNGACTEQKRFQTTVKDEI